MSSARSGGERHVTRSLPTPRKDALRSAVLLVLVGACFVLGGGSRIDITSLIFLQPLAVGAVVVLLLSGPVNLAPVRVPLLLLAALAAVMALQLVPLPPDVWTALPGRQEFVGIAEAAGISQPWRPISLSPDLTLSSLVGLAVPAAVLIGCAAVPRDHRYKLLSLLIGLVMASAVLGLAQISGGSQSLFYLYDVTNSDSAVGLFANRNHQAMFLSCAFPMLAVWSLAPAKDPKWRQARRWLAGAIGLFLVPVIVVTGSRAGLVTAVLGIAFAAAVLRVKPRGEGAAGGRLGKKTIALLAVGGFLALATAIALSGAAVIDRLVSQSATDDIRFSYWPTVWEIVADFWPVGSGFGTFDPIFRSYETFAMVRPAYFNHAHNDLLELAMNGGLPALLILAVLAGWLAWRTVGAFRDTADWESAAFARLAVAISLILLLGSLADYPLRVPSLMALFALATSWLGPSETSQTTRTAAGPPAAKALYRRRVSG